MHEVLLGLVFEMVCKQLALSILLRFSQLRRRGSLVWRVIRWWRHFLGIG